MEEIPTQNIPAPQPRSSKLTLVLVAITFLLFGLAGGYYLAKTSLLDKLFAKYTSKKACTMEAKICPDGTSVGRTGPNCEFSPCPTPTHPTINWQTYTNNKVGFLLQYPADYFKFQQESSSGVYLAPSQGLGGNGPKFLNKTDLWLEVSDRTPVDLAPLTTSTPVVIGGLNGHKYVSNFAANAGNVIIFFYLGWVNKDNKVYTISLSSWDADTLKNSEQLFDQILSTFKFTD